MDPQDLASRLKDMYEDGKSRGRAVAMALLFGIRYARDIETCGASIPDIVRRAGLNPKSYGIEVRKGCMLAEYVTVRKGSLPAGI